MLLTEKITDMVSRLDPKSKYLAFGNKTLTASVHGKSLFLISEDGIFLNGKNVLEKICEADDGESDTLQKYEKFIKNISQYGSRLNHVGIQYSCVSIEKEILWYKENVVDEDFSLFEEKSDDDCIRWFYLGNRTDWSSPLFEIVLRESKTRVVTDWVPHFQIDVDTDLREEEIKKIAVLSGLSNFIQWELSFPEIGTVLVMGPLGKIGRTSLCLGLGTKGRNVQMHRNELKMV